MSYDLAARELREAHENIAALKAQLIRRGRWTEEYAQNDVLADEGDEEASSLNDVFPLQNSAEDEREEEEQEEEDSSPLPPLRRRSTFSPPDFETEL